MQAQKIEKIVTNEDEVGIVIKQSKNSGSKVMENTIIKLTIGVLDTKVTMPNVEGLLLDKAITLLNKNNIKYEIKYETSDKENNTVLDQSSKPIKKLKTLKLSPSLYLKKKKLNSQILPKIIKMKIVILK